MTTGTKPKGQLMRLGLIMLVVLSGLCTIFVSVVTAAQAWQEHTRARWPEVTARVNRCGLEQTSSGRREKYYIHCRLSYVVGAEQNVTNIYSSNVPSPEICRLCAFLNSSRIRDRQPTNADSSPSLRSE